MPDPRLDGVGKIQPSFAPRDPRGTDKRGVNIGFTTENGCLGPGKVTSGPGHIGATTEEPSPDTEWDAPVWVTTERGKGGGVSLTYQFLSRSASAL